MAGFVPIQVEKSKQLLHGILIDDDALVHMTWKMYAEDNHKSFKGFYRPDDFIKEADAFDQETPIYIDSNLSNGVKGEEIAKKIHEELGFSQIYLCTGHDPNSFKSMSWIKAIVGKEPWSAST